jgi:IS30 family transposase
LLKKGLKNYHSPEQIAGRLKRASQESLSQETIYQMTYQNYQDCGKYQEYLRSWTRKKKDSKWSKKQV